MRLPFFALLVAAVIVSPGCRKRLKSDPAPAPIDDPAAASTPISVLQMTQALQSCMQNNSDFPKDLKVLVDMKLLPNLPPPPPGKQYVIDKKAVSVSLADQ